MISGTGSLFISKYRSCTAKTMAARTKISIGGAGKSKYIYSYNILAPEPGNYQAFSEFCIYESKNARDMEKMNKTSKTAF